MISLLLLYKIFQLFIFMLLGFILVKTGIVKSEDSKVLSKISLYLLMPSVIINSFDVNVADELVQGLIMSFASAIAIHIILFLIDAGYRRLFSGTNVERASIMYSNAGNLIIPIVSFLLGEEWLIYSCAFLSVQIFFLWTHGMSLFSNGTKLNIKKIICNVNIISILIGMILMVSGIKLPPIIKDVVSPLGSMLGPVGMIIAGMLAANMNYKEALKNKRSYLVVFMRLAFCPLVLLLLMKFFKYVNIANIDKILLISYLAAITPSASTVMQFAQISGNNEEYATAINIVSTILCIASMPMFVWLYTLI